MKPLDRRWGISVIFAALVLLSDLGSGLGNGLLPGRDAKEPEADWFWQGGGARILFADDMSDATAQHYAQMDYLADGKPFAYYGGAIATAGTDEAEAWDADRWRDDLLRWGQEGSQEIVGERNPLSGWERVRGTWSFGDGGQYPAGALAGVTSPVIDLRGVEPLAPSSAAGTRVDGKASPAADQAIASLEGDRTNARDTANQASPVATVDDDAQGARTTTSPLRSAAALRLRHAYGFLGADARFPVDGGRVEVSRYEPTMDTWSDWAGVTPVSRPLQVNGVDLQGGPSILAARDAPGTRIAQVGVQARIDPSGLAEGSAGDSEASAWVDGGQVGVSRPLPVPSTLLPPAVPNPVAASADPTNKVDPFTDGNVVSNEFMFPWLHGGPVQASARDQLHGPWEGFGGDSRGWVESVFDLTPYAGSLLRLRFLAASQAAPPGADPFTLGAGWALDQLEVSAHGLPGVTVLDLASPGDGALLGANVGDFHPVAVIQNEATSQVAATVGAALDGGRWSSDIVALGSSTQGRAFHRIGDSFHSLLGDAEREGVHRLHLTVKQSNQAKGADANLPVPGDASARTFHFQLGGGSAWRAVALLTSADEDNRLALRGQKVVIRATLENLGPEPLTLDLANDVRPTLRSLDGGLVGSVTPLVPASGSVTLQPSRSVSGAFGDPAAAVTVAWTWDGTAKAQPLQVRLEDGDGAVRRDGGILRVEAMVPDAMAVDLENSWEHTGGCARQLELQGHAGVLRCQGPGTSLSPATSFSRIQLLDGGEARIVVTHKGTGGTLRLVGNKDVAPSAAVPGPLEAGWHNPESLLGVVPLPDREAWAVDTLPLPNLPDRWEGWLRIEASTLAGGDRLVDSLRLEVGPPGRSLPALWHTFDVDLQPQANRFTALNGGDVARLTGLGVRGQDLGVEKVDGTVFPGNTYAVLDDGNASANALNLAPVAVSSNDKVHSDNVLALKAPLVLDGARPTLRFRHHLADAAGFRGLVEVQRQGPPSAMPTPWENVATYDPGLSSSPDMRPAQVRLWEFAGQTVLLRFRYESPTDSLVTQSPPAELGWIVGDVRVELEGRGGPQVLHESSAMSEQYLLQGVVQVGAEMKGTQLILPTLHPDGYYVFRSGTIDADGRQFPKCVGTDTYELGPSAISDPVDLRAMQKPILSLFHGGTLANLRVGAVHKWIDLEYQVLGRDQAWERWQSATSGASRLFDADGGNIGAPFIDTAQGQGMTWVSDPQRDVTSFELGKLAGNVVRFRFHLWEDVVGPVSRQNCIAEAIVDWRIYGMRVREPTHLADAGVPSLAVTLDDGAMLDRLAPTALPRPLGAAVVAVERSTAFQIRVDVANEGRLDLATDVALELDAPGARISFIDNSSGSPVPITGQTHGPVALKGGESAVARFRVELPNTPPGDYVITARAKATNALDTNPANDVAARHLVVQPVRALGVDRGQTAVQDFVGTPQDPRTVQLRLRNEGNVVERNVTVHAEVVRRVGLTQMEPIGYVLPSEPVALAPRTGSALKKWDLPDPRAGGLLQPVAIPADVPAHAHLQLVAGEPSGLGYLERVTAVRLRPDGFGSVVQAGDADFAWSLRGAPASEVPLVVHRFSSVPEDLLAAIDLDGSGVLDAGDLLLNSQRGYVGGGRLPAGGGPLPSEAGPGRFTFVDRDLSGGYGDGDLLFVSYGGDRRFGPAASDRFTIRVSGSPNDGTLVVEACCGEGALVGADAPVGLSLATFAGSLADNLHTGERYAIEFRVVPAADSVTQWWDKADPGKALAVVRADGLDLDDDQPELLDITDFGKCGCVRAPFLVEDRLWATDMASGSSVVPSFPAGPAWSAQTMVREDGEFVPSDGRAKLPAWRLLDGEQSAMPLDGADTKAWVLPAYEGLETVESTLTSPVLPAHIVDSASQAFLEMRYASDLDDGQAVVESRTLLGGQWSDWGPVDGLKSRRVAVVLAPDFPRVTGSRIAGLGTWMGDATAVAGVGANGVNPGWSPDAFTLGQTQYMISGRADGTFVGYRRDGDIWQLDAGITAGLDNIGSANAYPTVFQAGATTYLLGGGDNGQFKGFRWNGATWVAHADLVKGLMNPGSVVGSLPARPEVMTLGPDTYLFVPRQPANIAEQGRFLAFLWTGASWVPDNDVLFGLTYVHQGLPRQVVLDGVTYLVVGRTASNNAQAFMWTGSGWNPELLLVSNFLPGNAPVFAAFKDDGKSKVVVGTGGGPRGFAWSHSQGAAYPLLPQEGHPIPPFYTSYTGGAGDQPSGCDLNEEAGGVPTLCGWSPFPTFKPEGDAQWSQALADTLSALGEVVGPHNVGVFTTLEHEGMANADLLLPEAPLEPGTVPLNRSGHWIGVPRLTGSEWRGDVDRFPLRDLDALGLHLERYGAILLVGDNATTTFARRSSSLFGLSPDNGRGLPDEAAWPADPDDLLAHLVSTPVGRSPTPLAERHHEALFEILAAAPEAGVRTIGAIGPASATLALSGMDLQGVTMTAWMTPGFPQVPPSSMRCTAPVNNLNKYFPAPGTPSSYDPTVWGAVAPDQQPKLPCMANNNRVTVDPTNAWNYLYTSSEDAQTLAILDLLEAAGVQMAQQQAFGAACPLHDLNQPPPPLPRACILPQPVAVEPAGEGRPAIVTAARDIDAEAWVAAVLQVLDRQGELPEGSGQWQALHPAMATPVGGRFVLDEDGKDHYEGAPMQVRIRVRSDPDQRGHGWLVLDRLGVLGTNFTSDLGVRLADPLDGDVRQPGEAGFHPVVELTNRGTADLAGPVTVEARLQQVGDCAGSCTVSTPAPISFAVPGPLRAGEQRVVTLGGPARSGVQLPSLGYEGSAQAFFGGFFPQAAAEPTEFAIEARLLNAGGDEHGIDDADRVRVTGQTIPSRLVRPDTVRVEPDSLPHGEADQVVVHVGLRNDGSVRVQPAVVEVEVRDALPKHCKFNGARTQYWPCRSQGDEVLPLRLLPPIRQSVQVPRGQSFDLALPVDIGDLGPGTYRVVTTVRTQSPDGAPLTPVVQSRWLHLSEADKPWPNSLGLHAEGTAVASSQDYQDADANMDGLVDMADDDSFFMPASDLCTPDDTTRLGPPHTSAGTPLPHGWRLSIDAADACAQFQEALEDPVLEWRRDERPSTAEGAQWGVSPPPASSSTPQQLGEGDFGPDAVLWHPLRAMEGIEPDRMTSPATPFDEENPNGPALSLAAFEAGAARLALTSQYHATPNTAYVVEMQLARLQCNSGQNQPQFGLACGWDWTHLAGPKGDGWFPLRGSATSAPPPGIGTPLIDDCPPLNPMNPNSKRCTRLASNPLAGLPAIWGGSNAVEPGEPWPVLEYPLSLQGQGVSLAAYCDAVGNLDWENQGQLPRMDGMPACQFARSAGGGFDAIEGGPSLIPRPVRFRLAAASFGGDAGLNFWKVQSLALTEHRLSIEGPQTILVELLDGQSVAVPVRVRNTGGATDEVRLSLDADLSSYPDVHVGLSRRSTQEPQDILAVALAPDEEIDVWVHVDIGLKTGQDPGVRFHLPVRMVARSLADPSTVATALVDAHFRTRPWANLAIEQLAVDGEAGVGEALVSSEVPVSLTLSFANRGEQPIGGASQPIEVRFEAEGPDGTQLIEARTITGPILPCRQQGCVTFETVEWTPGTQGPHTLVATLNLPEAAGAILPENDYGDNRVARVARVGPVRNVELRPLDAWLVPFTQAGCATTSPPVHELVAGQPYCVAAVIANTGLAPAKGPHVQFSVDASDPFSFLQGCEAGRTDCPRSLLPNPFPGDSEVTVFSSAWTASRRSDGSGERDIRVQVVTAGGNLALEPFLSRTAFVNDYALGLPEGWNRTVSLRPGEQVVVSVNVTNLGTAVTTPTGASNGSALRVHVEQPPPLLPGENATVRIVVAAARSLRSSDVLPRVVLSTLEDPNVRLEVPLEFQVAVAAPDEARTLPLRAGPGRAQAEVALDGVDAGVASRWSLVGATAPLAANATAPVDLPAFGRVLARIGVHVDEHALPGAYTGNLTFRRIADGIERTVKVPYALEIEPRPGLKANAVHGEASAPQGRAALVQAVVRNTGNVPAEVVAAAVSDHGTVRASPDAFQLAPGASRNVTLEVLGDASLRSIGALNVTWRPPGGLWQAAPEVPWSADFRPAVVRIARSDLANLAPVAGRIQDVHVALENPAASPVEAEVLLILDGGVQSRRVVTVQPGTAAEAVLPFKAGAGAEGRFLVVARPAGTALALDDPAFYDVGDAVNARAVVTEPSFVERVTPGPAPPFLLVALAALALALRRRAA